MLNLFLIISTFSMLVYRLGHFYKTQNLNEPTIESIRFLLDGLQLFNNVTTFSIVSFFDHFFSHRMAAPFPSLFFLPVYSLGGVKTSALGLFNFFTTTLTVLFLILWAYEVKREGIFLRSKALRASLLFFGMGLLGEILINHSEVRGGGLVLLISLATLYYFRSFSYREHLQGEERQVRAFKSLSIALLFLLMSNALICLICFFTFTVLEVRRVPIEKRRKLSEILISIFSFKRLPAITVVMWAGILLFVFGISFKGILPLDGSQLGYTAFCGIFLRCFILYHRSFLDLIQLSWSQRQIIKWFLFPTALWMLYPDPNRFGVLGHLDNSFERTTAPLSSAIEIRESILPVLADDRRVQVFGIDAQDPRCRILEFELVRAHPDWSRNPEPVVCAGETRKIEAKDLEKAYLSRALRTMLIFYPPKVGIPFEIPLFLKNAKVNFEKVTFSLKSWGLSGAIFYLADEDG